MTTKKEINEYLFYEFGLDLDNSLLSVSENWPFQLELTKTFYVNSNKKDIYLIHHVSENYFVIDGTTLSVVPTNEMSIEDLYLQEVGSIAGHFPGIKYFQSLLEQGAIDNEGMIFTSFTTESNFLCFA